MKLAHSILPVLLAGAAAGCAPDDRGGAQSQSSAPSAASRGALPEMATAPSPEPPTPTSRAGFTVPLPSDAATIAFAKSIGVDCSDAQTGRFECIGGRLEVGDYFDVTFNRNCTAADFKTHMKSSHELRDRIAPLDTRTLGHVSPADALCPQAVGSINGEAEYFYVIVQPAGADCATDAPTAAGKGCGAGWVDAEHPKADLHK